MKTQIKTNNHRGLAITNIVLSIIFGVASAIIASFISIFRTDDVIGTSFGIIFVAATDFVILGIGLIWLVINFIYLAKMAEANVGLGSKTCSIFYGIAGGVVALAIIGLIISFILTSTDAIQYLTWVQMSIWCDAAAAAAFIASFIFTLIHLKRM